MKRKRKNLSEYDSAESEEEVYRPVQGRRGQGRSRDNSVTKKRKKVTDSESEDSHEDIGLSRKSEVNGNGNGLSKPAGKSQVLFSTFGAREKSNTPSSLAPSPAPSPVPSSDNVKETSDDNHDNDHGDAVEEGDSAVTEENKENVDGEGEKEEKRKRLPRSWWEPDEESGRFLEQGAKPRGFRFMKLNIRVNDANLLVDHVNKGNGRIKCNVKMNNVRKQMKMTNVLDTSVVVEKRTPESHPLICPFNDPVTNQPCDVMFKKSEQKFYKDHVNKGDCPFSQISQMRDWMENRELVCDLCQEVVEEDAIMEHIETKHLTMTCPACGSRHEDRMDVEDHIINGHATHFMSDLPSVYRKQKNKEEAEKIKEAEKSPEPEWDDLHRRSETRSLEQVIQETREKAEQEAQEKVDRERMIKEQAAYLASLKGNSQAASASQILQRFASGSQGQGQMNYAPRLPGMFRLNQQLLAPNASVGKVAIPRGQIRPAGPGYRARAPRPPAPTPAPAAPGQPKLQQLRMGDGSLMWALATGSEPLPGSNKSRTVFKVVAPVVPGQPPPQIVFRPAAPAPVIQPPQPSRTYPAQRGRPRASAPIPNKVWAPPRQSLPVNPSRKELVPNKVLSGRLLTSRTVVRPVAAPAPRFSVASNNGAGPGGQLLQRLQAQGSSLKPVTASMGDHSYGGRENGSKRADHSYGQSTSPDIEEIPEKDPLALDDDDLEAVDPYESESLIIPSINPDVDKDLAADDDDVIAA